MRAFALAFILAVLVLLFAPAMVRAAGELQGWPENSLPTLHYNCEKATGLVLVRVELAGHITKDMRLDCRPT